MPVVITNEHKNYYGSNYNRYSNQFYQIWNASLSNLSNTFGETAW